MEDEKAAPPPAAKSPSHMKLVLVGALALFVALVGAQVAVPLINGFIASGAQARPASDDGEALADQEALEEDAEDDEPLEPALYTALDPPFVVSYDSEGGPRYLQLTLQAMARSEKTIEAVKQHSPAIRKRRFRCWSRLPDPPPAMPARVRTWLWRTPSPVTGPGRASLPRRTCRGTRSTRASSNGWRWPIRLAPRTRSRPSSASSRRPPIRASRPGWP